MCWSDRLIQEKVYRGPIAQINFCWALFFSINVNFVAADEAESTQLRSILAAMAVSLPRPSLPPPTTALPLLPAPKVRSNLSASAETSSLPPTSLNPSKSSLRTPSNPIRNPPSPTSYHAISTSVVPTLRSTSSNLGQDISPSTKDVRRSVSIASFPQPPKASRRTPTESRGLPPISLTKASAYQRASENLNSPRGSGGNLWIKKPRTPTDQLICTYPTAYSPSLWNGGGDVKSVLGAAGARGSDGLTSQLSPSQSRSSSAQGSYSTSATTFEDVDENARRAREDVEENIRDAKRHSASKEGKGNVIVSVRVRPDAVKSSDQKSDGVWMVDGRKSLIAHRGRERGDYYYGM